MFFHARFQYLLMAEILLDHRRNLPKINDDNSGLTTKEHLNTLKV